MGYYIYLGAQLPHLVYGQNLPMSSVAFKALAREHLSSSDAALLDHCTLDPAPDQDEEDGPSYAKPGPSTGSKLLNRWREWERVLRLNLARNRALKLKREGDPLEAPALPADAVGAAKNVMTIESPLEAELFLDKARWDAIDNYNGIDIFSENAIYAYLLKLLLMERRAAFRTEEGFTEYKALYTAILGEAK